MAETQYAFDRDNPSRPIEAGDILTSGGGEQWAFECVSRPAAGHSTGRVTLYRQCPDARHGECPHFWHRNGVEEREFFPSVFDLFLGLADGTEA